VKVAALASLGQLLPLLPPSLVVNNKPPLLAHFAGTAKPPPQLAAVRVPPALCTPRLSGHLAAMRHRQRQQRRQQQRAAEVREQSYKQAVQELVQEADAIVASELQGLQGQEPGGTATAASIAATDATTAAAAAASSSEQGSSDTEVQQQQPGSSEETAAAAGASMAAANPTDGLGPWLLGTADDTPVGADDTDSSIGSVCGADPEAGSDSGVAATSSSSQQQQQPQKPPVAAPGTAAAELPCACAMHIGKVGWVGQSGVCSCASSVQGSHMQLYNHHVCCVCSPIKRSTKVALASQLRFLLLERGREVHASAYTVLC
jgi:hypothetical protein